MFVLAWLFLTYLLAAVPFGLLLTTLWGGDEDIRSAGSGNIGATNVARVYGWRLAVPVMIFDVGKGLVPVVLARAVWPEGGLWFLGAVAITAFLGHCYPVYLAFHGGKGVATAAGAMLALAPLPTLFALVAWGITLGITGRSSVASLAATGALVGAIAWLQPEALALGILLGVGIVQAHVGNIRRLIAGDEAAILRPVRWGRRKGVDDTDADAVLAHGPAGAAVAAPALWREAGEAGEAPAEVAEAPESAGESA